MGDTILSRYGIVRFTYRPRRAAGLARTRRRSTALRLFAYRQGISSRRDKDACAAKMGYAQG